MWDSNCENDYTAIFFVSFAAPRPVFFTLSIAANSCSHLESDNLGVQFTGSGSIAEHASYIPPIEHQQNASLASPVRSQGAVADLTTPLQFWILAQRSTRTCR